MLTAKESQLLSDRLVPNINPEEEVTFALELIEKDIRAAAEDGRSACGFTARPHDYAYNISSEAMKQVCLKLHELGYRVESYNHFTILTIRW